MPRKPTGNPTGRPRSAATKQIDRALKVLNKYDAAGQGRRLAGWNPPTQGPNRTLEGLQRIRNRARDVTQNDWSGESSIQKWTTSLVGIGITPRFKRVKDPARKLFITDLFNDFVANADADGVLNLYGMQTLVVRSWLDAGEVFIRRRPRFLDEGFPVPVQLQVIEAEFVPLLDVDTYQGLPAGNRIRSGIELDKRGKRVAYWLYKQHPGDDAGPMNIGADELVRVLAADICHVFEPKRPGQLRGVSMLAPVLNRLKNIENYDDAVLTRQQIANLLVGFIARDVAALDEDDDIDPLTNLPIQTNQGGNPLVGMQPGLIQELEDGQKVTWSNPPEAGTTYSDYMRTQHMGTAAMSGIPYELFSGDILNISDRTLRVIINEYRRFAEQRQWQIVIPMFCQPAIEWCMQAATVAGLITAEEYDLARRCVHSPHGWANIHPVQDPQGKALEVKEGFRSRSSVVGENGEDVDDVDTERQEDDQREQAREIGPYSKAAQVAAAPAAPANPALAYLDDENDEPHRDEPTSPTVLELALIARAEAETDALIAKAEQLRRPPAAPVVDLEAAARQALMNRAVDLLGPDVEPVSVQE